MDPICHTLVGATLSRAGLDRLTRRATATLILAANAPDVDILAAPLGMSLAWRRGATHGVPALVAWPFLIAVVMVAWDRWRRRPGEAPVRWWPLVGMSALGVLTHPFLDYLNNYGMRWLMPVRDRWFYGDSLFIVDPWLYLALGVGLWLTGSARRRGDAGAARWARVGLWLATVYIGLAIVGTLFGRQLVRGRYPGEPAPRFMVTARPVTPFVKQLIVDAGDHYETGLVRLLPPAVELRESVPRGDRFDEAMAALGRDAEGRAFRHWARFPAVVPLGGDRYRVYDLRYSDGAASGWAAVDVSLAP
ncbi:MAG: metal-dependent hydrolase [Gemmatimonadales bacterium]